MPTCEIHGTEATVKPAGVSKSTGRAYQSFYACPTKNEDGSFCQFKFTQRPPIAGFGVARANQAANTVDKDKQIKWLNGINSASQLISNGIIPVGPDWKVTLQSAATYVYGLQVPSDIDVAASSVPF